MFFGVENAHHPDHTRVECALPLLVLLEPPHHIGRDASVKRTISAFQQIHEIHSMSVSRHRRKRLAEIFKKRLDAGEVLLPLDTLVRGELHGDCGNTDRREPAFGIARDRIGIE